MAQKPSFWQNSKRFRKGISLSGQTLASHNWAADWARGLFKPSNAALLNLFLPQHPFWSDPKQSRTPYRWLTHGYYKDKVKTSAVHHIPFTFDRHICDLPQHPLGVLALQVKKPCSNDSWRRVAWNKKNCLSFGFGVLGPWDHDWGMFLGYFYDVIIRCHARIFWLEVF